MVSALRPHPMLTALLTMLAADRPAMVEAARRCSAMEIRQLSRIALSSVARDETRPAAAIDINMGEWFSVLRQLRMQPDIVGATPWKTWQPKAGFVDRQLPGAAEGGRWTKPAEWTKPADGSRLPGRRSGFVRRGFLGSGRPTGPKRDETRVQAARVEGWMVEAARYTGLGSDPPALGPV